MTEIGKWTDSQVPLPSNPDEWFLWTLDAMAKASKVRTDYFYDLDARITSFLRGQWVPSEGVENKDGRNILRSMHLDFIFALIRTIEAFLGASAVCWRFSTGTGRQRESKYLSRLLFVPNKELLREVQEKLESPSGDRIELCHLCGILPPELLDSGEHDRKVLADCYGPTLRRFQTYGQFAVRYLNEFERVRHAYAHNFRFVFFQGTRLLERGAPGDFDAFTILDEKTLKPGEMILVGSLQRKAMGELLVRVSQLEQWMYENIMLQVLNGHRLVPPHTLWCLSSRLAEDILRINKKLGCRNSLPAYRVEARSGKSLDRQTEMHNEFLESIKHLGPCE